MLQYLLCGKPHNHFWHHCILNAFSCPCSLLKTHRENWLDWEEDSADTDFFSPCVKKCHLYLDILKPFLQLLHKSPGISLSAQERQQRQLCSQGIMLSCFGFSAEAMPCWSFILWNTTSSSVPFSRACPLRSPALIALTGAALFLTRALLSTTSDQTTTVLLVGLSGSMNKPLIIHCFILQWLRCCFLSIATTAAFFYLLRPKAISQLITTKFLHSNSVVPRNHFWTWNILFWFHLSFMLCNKFDQL